MSKTILVTGSESGLGAAIVRALTAAGHRVLHYDRRIGDDVSHPEEWRLREIETLDVLINCAGINHNEWFEEVTKESLEKVMGVNAFSFVYMTQALLPQLKSSRGTVINIVSNAASIPMTSSVTGQ